LFWQAAALTPLMKLQEVSTANRAEGVIFDPNIEQETAEFRRVVFALLSLF